MRSPVDHEYPVPLYWQVAEAIKRQIADGVLNPGDKLPTEKWLTENYKVSRVTARKAVQTLIDNGTLERVRGESPRSEKNGACPRCADPFVRTRGRFAVYRG